MLQLYTKQAHELDEDLRSKVQLGQEDLILLTKKVGERGYQRQKLDSYGTLPDFDLSLMWPIPEAIPLRTPPLGRSHKKSKRV